MSTTSRDSSSTTRRTSPPPLTASAVRHARVDRDVQRWADERRQQYEASRSALDRIYSRGGTIPVIRG
ncbi:MAG TPA: hypothetical protein GX718_00085 [Brevibacterium sp.]|nr:hypothetical protein [Brevibacterium sp.]